VSRLGVAKFVNTRVPCSAAVLALSLITGVMVGWESVNASSSEAEQPSPEKAHNLKLDIKVVGKILTATMANNETARDFVSLLPLNLSMNDLFGREGTQSCQSCYQKRGRGRGALKWPTSRIGLRPRCSRLLLRG
jgi:hypothetical protein